MNVYPYPWPIGTCHFNELPAEAQDQLSAFIYDGAVDESFAVHCTPTEGAYINFAGWKVRVIIELTSPSTYIVRLA